MTSVSGGNKISLILHAPNIHLGGGRALLLALLEALIPMDNIALNLDSRLKIDFAMNKKWLVRYVQPSLIDRLAVERELVGLSRRASSLLCFGNLPPLFKTHCPTTVFFQNRNLLDGADLSGFSWRARQRHKLEKLWIRSLQKHADRFVVQGANMAESFKKTFASDRILEIWPLVPTELLAKLHARANAGEPAALTGTREFDFIYVSSGDPHKNHRRLIDAWVLLAADDCFPSLALTVDASLFATFAPLIEERRLRIVNFSGYDRKGVLALYEKSRCLVYPSLAESFGLPLLEAVAENLPILASDLAYVDEVVQASARFDASRPAAIAQAVKNFISSRSGPPRVSSSKSGLLGAAAFLDKLLAEEGKVRNGNSQSIARS